LCASLPLLVPPPAPPLDPPPSPTRRSSDPRYPERIEHPSLKQRANVAALQGRRYGVRERRHSGITVGVLSSRLKQHRRLPHRNRSEEHTSELQSLTNLVCRLLLEKKKTSIT